MNLYILIQGLGVPLNRSVALHLSVITICTGQGEEAGEGGGTQTNENCHNVSEILKLCGRWEHVPSPKVGGGGAAGAGEIGVSC